MSMPLTQVLKNGLSVSGPVGLAESDRWKAVSACRRGNSPVDAACGSSANHAQHDVVLRQALVFLTTSLPLIQCFDEEVHHARRVRTGRYRPCKHQTDLERLVLRLQTIVRIPPPKIFEPLVTVARDRLRTRAPIPSSPSMASLPSHYIRHTTLQAVTASIGGVRRTAHDAADSRIDSSISVSHEPVVLGSYPPARRTHHRRHIAGAGREGQRNICGLKIPNSRQHALTEDNFHRDSGGGKALRAGSPWPIITTTLYRWYRSVGRRA